MKNAVFYNLAITSLLSTFMLQLGNDEQNGTVLSVFAFFSVLTGLVLTDLKKIFSISEFVCNILIVLVLVFHLGYLIKSPTEFLAFSIANILVFIQLILFFKRKDLRACYHLLILSFIQVCVGCVFDQSLFFAFLLILYFFGLAGAVSLLAMNHEKIYYETHSFLRPSFQSEKKEKQKSFAFLRSAVSRFLSSIFALFQKKRNVPSAPNRKRRDQTSSLFSTNDSLGDRSFGFWEEVAPESVSFAPFGSKRSSATATSSTEKSKLRFPLLRRRPSFSGNRRTGQNFAASWELLVRLSQGTIFSLVFASVLFCLFPRFTDVEIGNIRFGYEGWRSGSSAVRNTVGFSENVQLGSLGPIGDNHESVMTIRLIDVETQRNDVVPKGEFVYLRGVAMTGYQDQKWSRIVSESQSSEPRENPWSPPSSERNRNFNPFAVNREQKPRENEETIVSWNFRQAGQLFSQDVLQNLDPVLFDSRNDLILQEVRLKPLNSQVVFSVWPFFRIRRGYNQNFLSFDNERFVRSSEATAYEVPLNFFTNAFRFGRQVELIPNQEASDDFSLRQELEIDETSLASLAKLARSWDDALGLPKDDYIGRAKNIERQLRDSGRFSYSRSGVARNRLVDPLEDFVTNHPQGHCEYFAGALVMMLRAVGIPSRMIIGFKYEVDPDGSGYSTVRQSDAHSWVEAYIPREAIDYADSRQSISTIDAGKSVWWANGGWLRLDATPYADAPLMTTVAKSYQSWNERIQSVWNDYILNFNQGRQNATFYQPVFDVLQRGYQFFVSFDFGDNNLFSSVWKKGTRFLNLLREGKWNDREFVQTSLGLGLFLLIVYFVLKRIILRLVWGRKFSETNRRDKKFDVQFYLRLEQFLEQQGIVRLATETPREFVRRFAVSATIQPSEILPPAERLSPEQLATTVALSGEFRIQQSEILRLTLSDRSRPTANDGERPPITDATVAVCPNNSLDEKNRFILSRMVLTIVEVYYRICFGGESVSIDEMKKVDSILDLLGA